MKHLAIWKHLNGYLLAIAGRSGCTKSEECLAGPRIGGRRRPFAKNLMRRRWNSPRKDEALSRGITGHAVFGRSSVKNDINLVAMA
jgi:hypothetical protein